MKFAHGPHERAQKRKLTGKEEPDIKTGFRPGGSAASHQTSAGLERLHAFRPGGFANVFKNNVAHSFVGDLLYFFGKFLLKVINDVVGAEFARLIQLTPIAGGGSALGSK